jgi:hypothetical protein
LEKFQQVKYCKVTVRNSFITFTVIDVKIWNAKWYQYLYTGFLSPRKPTTNPI